MRTQLEAAYRRGVELGRKALDPMSFGNVVPLNVQSLMQWARDAYPQSHDLDYWAELVRFDRERVENPPDATKFPETRGLGDLLRAERRGFLEGCGGGERELAFFYSWFFFITRRLNTRYAGAPGSQLQAGHCTAVYIRDSKEGGPLFGCNLDDVRRAPELEDFQPPPVGPDGKKRRLFRKQVSSAVLGDEEPQEIFPLDPWQILPPDCTSVGDMMAFMGRYTDFWGPHNGIVVDGEGDATAYEKSNCRLAVRPSYDGTAAVTACAYLDPQMKNFKDACGRRVLADDAPDWEYWRGCEARYHRLLSLTADANARGATLDDVVSIVTDHAAPFPDRICLAGQTRAGGEEHDPQSNWTLTSEASVLQGPHRRTLFWRVEGETPCYENPPFLVLGPGVQMQSHWCQEYGR